MPTYDDGILYLIQQTVPILKNLYKQFNYWVIRDHNEGTTDIQSEDYTSNTYRESLERFLQKAANPIREQGDRLIIFYHPEIYLDEHGVLHATTNRDALFAFRSACETNGIFFVDLTEDFFALYKERHVLPYGFINTSVGKGHMNRFGHRAVAERLGEILASLEE